MSESQFTTNQFFEDFAEKLVGRSRSEHGDIAFSELLARDKLDYSLESLRRVDEYLVALHERADELGGRSLFHTVLWGGAYVGEVIRRNAAVELNWVDYEDHLARHPDHEQLLGPKDVVVYAILVKGRGSFNLPISKVQKCIMNGIEDSVHFHAECELIEALRDRGMHVEKPRRGQ